MEKKYITICLKKKKQRLKENYRETKKSQYNNNNK